MPSDDYLATFTLVEVTPVNRLWGVVTVEWTYGPLTPDRVDLVSVPESSTGAEVYESVPVAAEHTRGEVSARVGGWQTIYAQPYLLDEETGSPPSLMPDVDGVERYFDHFRAFLRVLVPAPDEEDPPPQEPRPAPVATAHAERWGVVDVRWTSSRTYHHYDVSWEHAGITRGRGGIGAGSGGSYAIERARAGETYTAAVRGIARPWFGLADDEPSDWSGPATVTVPTALGYDTPRFAPGSRLSGMSTYEHSSALVIGADHQAWCATRSPRAPERPGWHMWTPVPGADLDPAGRLGVVARSPGHHTVAGVGTSGLLLTAEWHDGWSGWGPIDEHGAFDPHTAVSMTARNANHQDVAAVDSAGQVLHAAWHGRWLPLQPVGALSVPPGAPVALAARSNDHVDALVAADDGLVHHSTWNGAWGPWHPLPGLSTEPGAHVAIDRRHSDHFAVLCLDAEHRPMANFWHGYWRGWGVVGNGRSFPAGSAPALTHSDPDHMTAVLVDGEGIALRSDWNGSWTQWEHLEQQSHRLHPHPVLTTQGDRAALLLALSIWDDVISAEVSARPPLWSTVQ